MKKLILILTAILIMSCSTEKVTGNSESTSKFEGRWQKVLEFKQLGTISSWVGVNSYETIEFNDDYVEYDLISGLFQKGNFTTVGDSMIIAGSFYKQKIASPKNHYKSSKAFPISNYFELKGDTLFLERLNLSKVSFSTEKEDLEIRGVFKEKFVKLY